MYNAGVDDEIAEQLALRDSVRRKLEAGVSFEQRVKELFERMERGRPPMSPEGYQHFLRRNFRARAIDPPHEQQ